MAMETGCLHGAVDQRRETVAVFASISTTSLMSVRFAYTLPSPADAPYSGLPPSGMLVISFPAARVDHRRGVGVAIQREDAIRRAVVDDRIGILGGRDAAESLEGFQIEHDHGLVVTRGGEAMTRGGRHRGSMRAVYAGDFAKQFPAVFIDDHHAILPGDKQTVIGRVGHDVVPTAVPTQGVGVADPVGRR